MRLVFVQPRSENAFFYAPEPPLGLAYLAASLLEYNNDLEIKIIDGYLLEYNDYLREISRIDADVIGVTSTVVQLGGALKIPSLVNASDTQFIIGGPGVEKIPSSRLFDSGYLVLCHGEGERTIVELVEAFEKDISLKGIDGISYCSNGIEKRNSPRKLIENLDEIPLPARNLLNMEKYINKWEKITGVRTAGMISSRGCPFSCRFCDRSIFGRRIRFTSLSRIIEEMKQLYYKYNVESIFFADDLFTLNKRRVLDFCDTMNRELPEKKWGAQARIGTVDFEMLSRMKQAGCTELAFGVESGSQRLLDFLGKGIKVDQIKETFEWVNELDMNGGMYLIVGIPGEKQIDIDMTKKLILDVKPKSIILSFLVPIPGTELFEMTKHFIRQDADFFDFNFFENESIYEKKAFNVEPKERYHEIMDYFLGTFKGKINPNCSIYSW